ncbi:MAG: hypothetical protein M1825_003066 [Sarcosagium campestre]|nr:MAG: hypothetical protein M1825_003066 [Sarcosagium campestre]
MDQQNLAGPTGPGGRRLHIAHRRSPSELTPLMSQQLAIQQQLDSINQQQQQLSFTYQQYASMGMLPHQQHLSPASAFNPVQGQIQGQVPNQIQGQVQGQMAGQVSNLSPNVNAFQFPQQLQQQQQQQQAGGNVNAPHQPPGHRRNQSALPNMGMGPPPAPSSGASGSAFGDPNQASSPRDGGGQRGGRGGHGGPPGSGHQRRHSLALPEAKKAAELAQQKRGTSGFQFPIPTSSGATPTSANRENSPHTHEPADGYPPKLGQESVASQATPTARGGTRQGSHGRSQSMANASNGRSPAHGRGPSGFQFPLPTGGEAGSTSPNQQDFQRRGSQTSHARTGSRNFEGNWRNQASGPPTNQEQQSPMGQFSQSQNPAAPPFQPGHRARGSINQSIGSLGSFQYQAPPQVVQLPGGQVVLQQQPPIFPNQQLSQIQLSQLQALQAAQMGGQQAQGLQASQHAQPALSHQQQQQQQQQQRKTLFTPYLPQANLPALLGDGQLVAGILRVNKKNRSDAYVSTQDGLLDADIFICGSKDRNRALEGDLVAVELLDVDEVWGQKRDKEEKKKRKDITDTRTGSSNTGNDRSTSATSNGDDSKAGPAEGGLKRRGSLRQRPTQKKNDDVEVEGQSLLLVEEEELSDEQKPLYAGHVVAVIERVAGQMFSGTLGLLRPSSQATKEKQEAERQARDGGSGRHQPDRHQDKPKIVWFKPTDKRVPLIAIPTEQAPRDFVEKHQDYANRIFVACIKRWPITSLHPFGTLVEQLGEMGDLKVETDALLRDNNFGSDDFADAVIRSVGFEEWSVARDGEAALSQRRDFRQEKTFTIDPNGVEELDDAIHVKSDGSGKIEIGIHIADVAHFIKSNSLVDREAKKRGTGVYLMNRTVSMLPPRIASEICCLSPGQERYTVSVVFKVDADSGHISEDDIWIGKSIIKSSGKLSYRDVDSVLNGKDENDVDDATVKDIQTLHAITKKFRASRFGSENMNLPALRLLYQLDDENVPVEENIFNSSPAHELIEELTHKANSYVAQKIATGLPDKAFLRRHAAPNPRRLQTFATRMNRLGYNIDTSSSGSLQSSLFKVEDADFRKGLETLLVKSMQRARYIVAGKTDDRLHQHYALNLPLYTHFTNPSRRYADIVVHRQLEAVLADRTSELPEDAEALVKTAEQCNTKKDSAMYAQEQSVHIESCRNMDRKRQELGGDLISEGIVICVYESAFDVLIPEYGFEKRVHCDQLPLKKAEFDKTNRVLELYWEKGVASSAYVPEDERPKAGSSNRGSNSTHAWEAAAAERVAKDKEDAQRRHLDTGAISTDDVDALFADEDDDDGASEITDLTAGISLNPPAEKDRPTQGVPPSPTKDSTSRSDPKLSSASGDASEDKLSNKEKYLKLFKLREENGDYIQDVTEMTRVPVILKTDLTKSPPCLTIRSLNPFAL